MVSRMEAHDGCHGGREVATWLASCVGTCMGPMATTTGTWMKEIEIMSSPVRQAQWRSTKVEMVSWNAASNPDGGYGDNSKNWRWQSINARMRRYAAARPGLDDRRNPGWSVSGTFGRGQDGTITCLLIEKVKRVMQRGLRYQGYGVVQPG